MDKNEDKDLLMKRRLAVALYAQANDVYRTKAFAERNGLTFDKEQIFSDLEFLFDIDTANVLRSWWDEKRRAAFDQKLMQRINDEEQKFLREQRELKAGVESCADEVVTNTSGLLRDAFARLKNALDTIKIKYSVKELMVPLQWSISGFAGDLRGEANASLEGDHASRPVVKPSLYIEEGELKICLRLYTKGCVLPETKEAISLFVDGKYFSEFVFERSAIDTIWIVAKIDDDSMVNPNEMSFDLYYSPDLKEISIVVGDDPNELS